MSSKASPRIVSGLLLLGGMLAALVVPPASAAVPCTNGPTFSLQTAGGYVSTPDGNSVFMWSFAVQGGAFQVPSPVLCVTQGQTVTINLTNNLPEPVSIIFPGQSGVTATGGAPGLFTQEAATGGGTVSYSFVATEPGTYLYESGTNPHKQVHMGLYGAIIVRPSIGANFAYNDASTEFNPAREYLLIIHDMDSVLHQAVERNRPYDVTLRHDKYWQINGRSFPDTINDNGASWLPNQPYGALVRVEPYSIANPLPALVRYANAGWANHPFHPHGNNLRIIGRDGRLLAGSAGSTALESFTTTVGSGQTYDLFAWWFDAEGWNSTGNPIPVEIPGLQNLTFKDSDTFYSGSPYLGEKGILPTTVNSFNECGEFYFPWHSHALNEFQNFDEGFGGLATLWRIDPPAGCP